MEHRSRTVSADTQA